eukprot:Phypoly_transcript_01405.p1 GENE.Phypoly_transcript_01405~~Phypoly_transcript_01405.p1  ORF type:complete len:722 (+),score=60.61 Phypoly_transcript_01405:719-2884(+)
MDRISQLGLRISTNTFSSLATACVECGSVVGAKKLLAHISNSNAILPTTTFAQLVKVFTNSKLPVQAIAVLPILEKKGFHPTPHIYSSILTCCANAKNLEVGKQIHQKIPPLTLQNNTILQNSLINMYFKCGDATTAEQLFIDSEKKRSTDSVTWNIIITERAKRNKQSAFNTFLSMLAKNVPVERQHITALFNACSEDIIDQDKKIIPKTRTQKPTRKECKQNHAHQIMDGIKKHNTNLKNKDNDDIIKAYCRAGKLYAAEDIFSSMSAKGILANTHACASILASCTENDLKLGNKIVDYVHRHKIEGNATLYTAMMNMYLKCGEPQNAYRIWHEVLGAPSIKLDTALFQSAISTCAECAAGSSVKCIHDLYKQSGYNSVILETSLINAYASCANLHAAEELFGQMKNNGAHDNVTWNAMLKSYATLGQGQKALRFFNEMVTKNISITHVTICVVLNACSHSGLVEEAQKIYNLAQKKFNIHPTTEIQNCMVDVLARSGRLADAEDFIKTHIKEPNHVTWIAYTSGCRISGDINRAKIGVGQVLKLYPDHPATLVLKSNLYASERNFAGVQQTREYMNHNRIKKDAGHSWIEVNGKVHSFLVNDRDHPDTQKIYAEINKMRASALAAGYQPKTHLVLHEIPEEQKRETLWYHCEKLAVAYGIISTPSKAELVIKKNVRICTDCHEAIKYISKIYERRINVSDAARWHVFENGKCSCNDFF